MDKRCDVLIIGAGPAGAGLANLLAEEGVDAILIDKRSEVDRPVRCAEYVPAGICRLDGIPVSGIELSTGAMTTYIDYRQSSTIKAPGFMLDRRAFTSSLVDNYKKRDGVFMNRARAVSFNEKDGLARTEVIRNGKILYIYSQAVVGADGPGSMVGRYIDSVNTGFLLGLNENIPAEAWDKSRTMVFFSPEIPGGYGWLFPKQKTVNLGIGCAIPSGWKARRLYLRRVYGMFREKIASMRFIRTGRRSGEIPAGKISVGIIPSSGIVDRVARKNYLLIGDAAGLSNPITGAGIYNAVYSAEIALDIIVKALEKDDTGQLRSLRDEYRQHFGRSMERAAVKREYFLSNWSKCASGSEDFEQLVRETWVAFRPYWKRNSTT